MELGLTATSFSSVGMHFEIWQLLGCFFFRFTEKGNLEVLLFTIQSKMRANNQKPYTPKEGKMLGDINRAWEQLEKAEHERELALRDELIRYDFRGFSIKQFILNDVDKMN